MIRTMAVMLNLTTNLHALLRHILRQTIKPVLSINTLRCSTSSSSTVPVRTKEPGLELDRSYLSCLMAESERRIKVAVLISGGFDCSVPLRLLHAVGHRCTAFYLKIWIQDSYGRLHDKSKETPKTGKQLSHLFPNKVTIQTPQFKSIKKEVEVQVHMPPLWKQEIWLKIFMQLRNQSNIRSIIHKGLETKVDVGEQATRIDAAKQATKAS